jgi:putative ubiquitin-RnfH superfamily antitoxin RatB of RatAB toxin-antitoxin module
MASTIKVCDTDSGGLTQEVRVPDGCTVRDYFRQNKAGCDMEQYRIRINEQPATPTQMLYDGDRMSISRAKLAGARHRRRVQRLLAVTGR